MKYQIKLQKENIKVKFRKPTIKARNLKSFMAKIRTDTKKMRFFKQKYIKI